MGKNMTKKLNKSENFAQSQQNVVRTHVRVSVTFRNSAQPLCTINPLQCSFPILPCHVTLFSFFFFVAVLLVAHVKRFSVSLYKICNLLTIKRQTLTVRVRLTTSICHLQIVRGVLFLSGNVNTILLH